MGLGSICRLRTGACDVRKWLVAPESLIAVGVARGMSMVSSSSEVLSARSAYGFGVAKVIGVGIIGSGLVAIRL